MKEQHRIETPRERHDRGLSMSADDFGDLAHLRGIEATLTDEQLEEFRELLFSPEIRGNGGIRLAADLAVRKLRKRAGEAIANGLVKDTWRACL